MRVKSILPANEGKKGGSYAKPISFFYFLIIRRVEILVYCAVEIIVYYVLSKFDLILVANI